MKIISLFGFAFLILLNVHGQTVSPEVVAGSGTFFTGPDATLSWTLGETVVATFEGSNSILTQGFQQSWASVSVDCQTLTLPALWSFFSTYIIPDEPAIDSVLESVVADIVLIKNGGGFVYWPQFGVNTIGTMVIGEGYQAKMAQSSSLEVCGTAVAPETIAINIPQAWSILGYLRQSPSDVSTIMSSIVSAISLMKDEGGQVFWPQYQLNSIGNMDPGKGYQIKLDSPQTFIYAPNGAATKLALAQIPQSVYFGKAPNTGTNMTLGIPVSAWETLPTAGDEIGIKNKLGQIVGASVFTGTNMAIAVWGNDGLSNTIDGLIDLEEFSISVWSSINKEEYKLQMVGWETGDALFKKDKISVIGSCNIPGYGSSERGKIYSRAYPNPFTDAVCLEFYIPVENHVSIKIYNALGELIATPIDGDFAQGLHQTNFNRDDLPSGNYYYRLITNSGIDQGKLIIL